VVLVLGAVFSPSTASNLAVELEEKLEALEALDALEALEELKEEGKEM
jgi:hypothetical protein